MSIRVGFGSLLILLMAYWANQNISIDSKLHHLRSGDKQEWSDFAKQAEADQLTLTFAAQKNSQTHTLLLRQKDVKHSWKLTLNGKSLGRLQTDENDLITYLAIPPNTLRDGQNELTIEGSNRNIDDIQVGDIRIVSDSPSTFFSEAKVQIKVIDVDSGNPLPCRLTIANESGTLVPIGAKSDNHLVVRTGVVYTADGNATFGLAAGKYRLYAGRGFEYSLDECAFEVKKGETFQKTLKLKREVATPNLVSCDTHIHCLTYSGHGDATINERMITIAGEGIEVAIATDHNYHTNYESAAQATKTRSFFTPVIGNEVTTKIGHFNAFPILPNAKPSSTKFDSWKPLTDSIRQMPGVEVVILNHPRDVHSGFQPTGPKLMNSATGEQLEGWELEVDGFEVVTSAALQSDAMLLYRDWFALLNRGILVAPIGCSDSHDVNRYIFGQGRTYLPVIDDDPAKIDVAKACEQIKAGRVIVSMGLLAELQVNSKHGPGDTVMPNAELVVDCKVQGPTWVAANHIMLFANGQLIREEKISDPDKTKKQVIKWHGQWKLPQPKHDIFLTVVATGPGPTTGFWRIPKPYQAASKDWNPVVISSTGAVWIDADHSKKFDCAFDYAKQIVKQSSGNADTLLAQLKSYDVSVVIQTASEWDRLHGMKPELNEKLRNSAPHIKAGFSRYLKAKRESELARQTE